MHIRMTRNFDYDVAARPGVFRTLPAGWVGEVEDEVGAAAIEAGAAEDTQPKEEKKPLSSKEIIAALSAEEKAAFDKMDQPAKAKFLADKKAAAVAAE